MSASSPRRPAALRRPRPRAMAARCSSRGRSGSARRGSSRRCSAEAEELGFHTLRGAAHEEEGRTPYAPLVEALDPLAARRPELAGALTDSAQAALARLLPSVRRPAGAAERGGEPPSRLLGGRPAARAGRRRARRRARDRRPARRRRGDGGARAPPRAQRRRRAPARGRRACATSRSPSRSPSCARACSSAAPRSRWRSVRSTAPRSRRSRERAAGRPLPPGALAAIERSAAGNPFFAEELAASVDASGEVTVPPRLREVVARRLERLEPLGERLLAALAVIDDGFTRAELAALAGAERGRRGARRGRGGRRARDACAAATASGTRSCARSWPPGCPRRRCAAPTPRRPRCSPRTTRLPRRSRITCCAPAARGRPSRCSRGRPSGPPDVGAYRDGAEWAELALEHADEPSARALLALRAQLLHGAGEARAPRRLRRGDRGRARGARARAARATGARVPRGRRHPGRAQGRARRRCRPSVPRTSAS